MPPTYTTNDWRGHAHHECDQCPYDTLDEADMVQHIREHHAPPPPPKPPIEPTTTAVYAEAVADPEESE